MKKNPLKAKRSFWKHKMLLLVVACSAGILLCGCQSDAVSSDGVNIEENQSAEEQEEEAVCGAVSPVFAIESAASDVVEEAIILFPELAKYQFEFASGAGAWRTVLTIREDGAFAGTFIDSDMGDVEDDHPNGVVYSCTFEGKFTAPEKVNDYTYSLSIEYINLEREPESEEIIDGVKYIYSEPYGLENAKEILIYTPEAPVRELPEGFRNWVHLRNLEDLQEETLGFYGLYNVEAENGFSSYPFAELTPEQ